MRIPVGLFIFVVSFGPLEQGGNLMAVDASTFGDSFRFGSPHFLFHTSMPTRTDRSIQAGTARNSSLTSRSESRQPARHPGAQLGRRDKTLGL
jgi:hypothetical protein